MFLHWNFDIFYKVYNESALPIKAQAVYFMIFFWWLQFKIVSESDMKRYKFSCFFMQSKSVKERPKSEINVNSMNNDPIIQSQSLYSPPENNVTVYTEMTGFTAEGQSGLVKTRTLEKVKKTKQISLTLIMIIF